MRTRRKGPVGMFLYPMQESTLTWVEKIPSRFSIQMLPWGTVTSRSIHLLVMTVPTLKRYYCGPLLPIASWLNPCLDLWLEITWSLHRHPGVKSETVTASYVTSLCFLLQWLNVLYITQDNNKKNQCLKNKVLRQKLDLTKDFPLGERP